MKGWLSNIKWHHYMRAVATVILVDQSLWPGLLPVLPSDTAYFLAAFGALVAPVPTERHQT